MCNADTCPALNSPWGAAAQATSCFCPQRQPSPSSPASHQVRVADKVVTKAGTPVVVGPGGPVVVIDADEPKYVCRAGLKMEKALAHWGIDVR